MAASKRLRQSMLTRENNFATSTSTFIETILTPTTSISPTIETHKESIQTNQLIVSQQDNLHQQKSPVVQDEIKILSKSTITKTDVDEDDWVCPVAVALRRAGYNVPLRPSKSWLERDRKKQALLRAQQTVFKEM